MLKHITIRNFALIEKADVDFTGGFSVITGETGHGKSVFLGSVAMLLGQRSDAKIIREGADRCVVEGCFDVSGFGLEDFFEENDLDYDTECIIRREVLSTGRSRAFVNDTPVSVAQLKELGTRLIDIHSQHQNLLLGDRNYQLGVLDVLAGNKDRIAAYRSVYDSYVAKQHELSALKEALERSRLDEEWLRYQLNELESAQLKEGEQEELEQEEAQLSHSEDIQAALYGASVVMDGDELNLLRALKDAASSLEKAAAHYAPAGDLAERLDSCYIELKDCCAELQQHAEHVQFDPERLDWVSQRLALFSTLMKKHRVGSVEELVALEKDYASRLDRISCGDDDIMAAEHALNELRDKLAGMAAELTAERRKSAVRLQEGICDILVNLGMPRIRFEVEFKATPGFTSMGVDNVTFLFTANSSSAPQPLSDVASGGEMARVMLALKSLVVTGKKQPTLIFDEVDTGVSGVLAERMGRLMQQMAGTGHQVLSITHLPQVAALGSCHYKVFKNETAKGTVTDIVELKQEERVREIAQMMSGEMLTDAAMENAALLLSQS